MILFRQYRGGYEESMETVMSFSDKAHLLSYISMLLGKNINEADVYTDSFGIDPRNGWNTHYVMVDGEGVIGYVNGPINIPNSG